ncbi:MAG: hypothetical protein A3C46_04950 [Deltaproteobacteria bacterium RIFCSPHIGHO2_02_FULL_44_16]|nr:MAG: hypothetical protein A3C46_04950 [Deltaproteobacteria bacterium RIFCSPHIGHO2_02_FULL_44_16]
MIHPVKVPSAGESVTEAFIGEWKVHNGDVVKKGQVIVDLESQKATFELEAESTGRIEIKRPTEGDRVTIGEVIATIDDANGKSVGAHGHAPEGERRSPLQQQTFMQTSQKTSSSQVGPAARRRGAEVIEVPGSAPEGERRSPLPATPSVQPIKYTLDTARGERAEKASRIRKQIAQNLVTAQHTAAILTTFNEVDMSAITELRKKYKDSILKKHGVKIGMVGPFAMAAKRALLKYPLVNSTFTGEEIIKRDFIDLSIAVSTEKGLVVPVIKDLQGLDWIGFEKKLTELATKARDGKLSIPEMTGGTFTITNGGVFGSLLATPLLNMPQSAILGLHKIEDRPVALEGKVVVRPMMYIALSYDHRLLDGKDAIEFIVSIKEAIENPSLIIDESILK